MKGQVSFSLSFSLLFQKASLLLDVLVIVLNSIFKILNLSNNKQNIYTVLYIYYRTTQNSYYISYYYNLCFISVLAFLVTKWQCYLFLRYNITLIIFVIMPPRRFLNECIISKIAPTKLARKISQFFFAN